MRMKFSSGSLDLDEDGTSPAAPEAVVNTPLARPVLRHHFADVVPLPAESRQHRKDRALPGRLLATRQEACVGGDAPDGGLQIAHVS